MYYFLLDQNDHVNGLSVKLKSVLKMILDSKKWKKMEQLFNDGETKTSPGFLASVNTGFSSKKNEFSFL